MHTRRRGCHVVDPHITGAKDNRRPTVQALRNQILGQFSLAVHHHLFVNQTCQINAVATPIKAHLKTGMGHSLTIHPRADTRLAQRLDCAPLENPSANSGLDMRSALAIYHHSVDAIVTQQFRQ